MRYTAYYAIRGKPELRARLEESGCEFVDLLTRPALWSNEQGGRTVWMPEDFAAGIKRLYVAWARYIVLGEDKTRRILGDLPITEVGFDRWWEAELFDGIDSTTAEILEELETIPGLDIPELFAPNSVHQRP